MVGGELPEPGMERARARQVDMCRSRGRMSQNKGEVEGSSYDIGAEMEMKEGDLADRRAV